METTQKDWRRVGVLVALCPFHWSFAAYYDRSVGGWYLHLGPITFGIGFPEYD